MALFGSSKPKSYLGVDIGVGGMKLIELANEKGRARLLTYAYSERPLGEQGQALLDDPKTAADLLTKMVKQSGASTTQAVSSLPQHAVFQAVVSIPKMKDVKQMKALVEAQVAKLSAIPITDMIIDSRPLVETKEEKKEEVKSKSAAIVQALGETKERETMRVLVTGASKTLVQKYVEIFKLAKLNLVALETESLALIRSLIGHDRATIMMIDVGAMRTNITVVERGIPALARSVNVGGAILTKQIAEQMGLSLDQAEQMKLDLGKGEAQGIPPSVEAVLQPILTEINFCIGEYARQDGTDGRKVEKVILTGGSAQLPGVVAYLSGKLNMNVYIGDPWARVAVPEQLRPVLDEIGPRFAVSVGLAMRDIE